ncbi:hypothetical protein L1049_023857 [Liquidambar formosana]|uniref:non-specific serine/threonine protein kinase n=1 Tax=Liquidambar formosana TaxID=63359 RepID=A0AAP0X0V7_LIQFO
MTVAEIGAAFLCQDIENPFGGAPLDSGSSFDMPFPCHSKAVVYRFRNRNMLESFSGLDRLPEARHGEMMLPAPAPSSMIPLHPKIDKHSDFPYNNSEVSLPLPPSEIKSSGISDVRDARMLYNDVLSIFSERTVALSIVAFIIILVVFFIFYYAFVAREQVELNKQPNNSNAKNVPSKRKKIRKSGKNNSSVEKKDKHLSSENEDGFSHSESDNTPWMNLNKLVDGGADGRRIGRLFVSNKEIAKGSNGTVVFEGIYEGRPVAVKRLVQAHHDVAFKEIQNLIASDQHPNIVRWYGVEYDQDFVYLSLERCTCSLDDLIQIYSDSSQNTMFTEEQASRSMIEYKDRLDLVKVITSDTNLWKGDGYPSPLLLQLMRDVVSGLMHLHELGIIHRDLKPQNVLISKERSLCAKLSDMGISKRLIGDMSSLGHNATGKPKALEVLHHPLFWNSEMRLSFLRDISDRVELEDRESDSDLLKALESIAPMALGAKWDEKMEPAFIANIGRYRRYKFDSVRDLLRVMRNKLNHYRELPKEIQEILGPVPEGFDGYFAIRFPKLLIEVYKVVYRYCREEECFQKYLKSSV